MTTHATTHSTVLATWLDAVVDQLALQDLDTAALTAGLGDGHDARIAPTRQVALVIARQIWQRAAALTSDPLLGLKVGHSLPLQALNITGLVMMHSPTLRDGLRHVVRFQQLVSHSGCLTASRTPGGLTLGYLVTPCHVPMHSMQIDSLFAGLLAFVRRCCVRPLAPSRVSLPCADRRLEAAYRGELGCPVVLGAPHVAVVYDDATLDTPFQGADPRLLALAVDHATRRLASQNSAESLVAAVRAELKNSGFASVTCDGIANRLGVSTRTLQRRLADAGTPFRRLLEAARMEEALFELAEGTLPLPDIAARLGYAEQSSFWRAVRTCWGATPRALRLQASARAAG